MSSASHMKDLPLGIPGFQFSDLYQPLRLKDLHNEFWKFAEHQSSGLRQRFDNLEASSPPEQGNILIDVAKVLGDFIARLFNVSSHAQKLNTDTQNIQPAFRFKKEFLNTRVFKRFIEPPLSATDFKVLEDKVQKLTTTFSSQPTEELRIALTTLFLVESEKKAKTNTIDAGEQQKLQVMLSHLAASTLAEKITLGLKDLEDWCTQVFVDVSRRQRIKSWLSYVRAAKLEFEHLVPTSQPDSQLPEKLAGPKDHLRHREGFKLTDPRMSQSEYLREVDYCIYCHQREKDSCSKGFKEKEGTFKKNPLGIPLQGCPLDERISEMHILRKDGHAIGSLAMVMLDNPMCPGTGHRICNDCMKGCIFQKQDPVNIPQSETGTLTDVLNLPYGFEIYSLLTRFNPLNKQRPYALPYNGKNILVVGLGPAGYTVSHYLANEGFGIVGIDGLKLEPVDANLTGKGKPFPKPIQQFSELKKELDERILMGFGGVSEYGITVRWDKNFLSVIYLSLLRRSNFKCYGGVRFGGTLTVEDAWDIGFDHICLATGAGKPTIIDMKNNLIRGIRKASDFLMALQLTGAFKKNAMANLQVQLPALIIGGGLTAVDTATELLAYYPIQVEKALERFEILSREMGEDKVWALCDAEEKKILETFLLHGRAVREERQLADKQKRPADLISLCRKWGGVAIAYRKKMNDSPAYRLNHEEVIKALEEGIYFIENVSPTEAIRDEFGAVSSITFKKSDGSSISLPAKSVMVAAGTSPNTIYEREFPGTFKLDDKKYFFSKHRVVEGSNGWSLEPTTKQDADGFFLSYDKGGKFVTFYGDNHPDFNGNVVKAMASAKKGYPHVAKLFRSDIEAAEQGKSDPANWDSLVQTLDISLIPRVVRVDRLTETIVEVVLKAPYAAKKFEPGQFYRLQNYESSVHSVNGTKLLMEGLALTGAWVDKENDLLSLIVLEMGGSSRLCSALKPGEAVVVMGPTGTPSEIPENETVLLAGGGLGNAVLLSISRALRAKGNKVVYFAGYRKNTDLFKQDELEEATDQMIWAVDKGDPITPRRPQDLAFVGNIVQAMDAYASGKLQANPLYPLHSVDRILAIGSDRMMAAVHAARSGILKPYLKKQHVAIGSINSSMQCMMKEVCAQCLQRHIDPITGKETFVFSCFNQDQDMSLVDWKNLNERLKMNSLQEKLANLYLDFLRKSA